MTFSISPTHQYITVNSSVRSVNASVWTPAFTITATYAIITAFLKQKNKHMPILFSTLKWHGKIRYTWLCVHSQLCFGYFSNNYSPRKPLCNPSTLIFFYFKVSISHTSQPGVHVQTLKGTYGVCKRAHKANINKDIIDKLSMNSNTKPLYTAITHPF